MTMDIKMEKQVSKSQLKAKAMEIFRFVENTGESVADVIPGGVGDHLKREAAIANILKSKKHLKSDKALEEIRNSGRG